MYVYFRVLVLLLHYFIRYDKATDTFVSSDDVFKSLKDTYKFSRDTSYSKIAVFLLTSCLL